MPEPISDLTRLETDLQRLAPMPAQIDRDNLFHAAGRIQGERRVIFWKVASLTLAVLAISLAAGLLLRPVRVENKVIAVAVPVSLPAAAAPSEPSAMEESVPLLEREPGLRPTGMSYQEMRLRGLRNGSEALMVPVPQQISADVPRNRPVEDDLNLPRETLKEWNSSQRVQ